MKKVLLKFSREAERLEELIPAHLQKLEEKKDLLDERIDEYESKDCLTERQEEKLSEWEDKVSDIDDEIEVLENVLSSIQDIRTELIGYLSTSAVTPLNETLSVDDDWGNIDLEEEHEDEHLYEQQSTLGTAIKAVIATELTIAALKNGSD